MQKVSDYDVKQAIGIVARLGGFTIKSVATSDDLKERTLTVKIVRVSDGWVQETIDFEDIPAQLATVDTTNGHVDKVETGDGWKDEAAEQLAAGAAIVGASTTGPDVTTTPVEQTVDDATASEMHPGVDEAKPAIHLVGEAAALGKKRR